MSPQTSLTQRAAALAVASALLVATLPAAAQSKSDRAPVPPNTQVIELDPAPPPEEVGTESLWMLVAGSALAALGVGLVVVGATAAVAGGVGLQFLPLQPAETPETRSSLQQGLLLGGGAGAALGLLGVVIGSGFIVGHYVLE